MAFQLKTLQTTLVGAMGAGLLVVAAPALAQSSPERLERVEVTGSNIKRTDQEGVSPVEIITREEIQRTGKPNIAEVLRQLPINSGSYNEQAANSFAPGAAGISLRGLGQKATLVLLNGRRTASYGFAQNLQDTFVDLNSIPTSAVERVEILKDGASAIYGSDAIAGVVNIILRKDYQGLEATLGGGRSEGKNEYQGNIVGGFGDLSRDKFNVFGSLDLYKRDLLEGSDTEFGSTRDFRKQIGGRNATSLTGGGTWRQVTGAATLTNNYRASTSCVGQVLTGPQAVAAGLINLSPNLSAATLATNTAMAAATNTFCAKDFNDQFTALPKTERASFLGRANYQITPSTLAYLEVGLTKTYTEQTFQDPFFAGTTGLQQTPAGLRPFVYNVTFAPGVAGNPYATNARYVGVQTDLGTRDSHITSDTGRFVTGLNYTLAGWDFDSGAGFSRNNVKTEYLNRTTLAGTSAAFNVPTTPQPPVPISTASSYNLDNTALNSQAARDQMLINFPRKSSSQLAFVDTKATTEIQQVRLPGGPLGVAVGAEYRDESLKDRPAQAALNGNILGQGVTSTDGNRQSYAGYVEFAVPIFKQLESQLAYRFDHYSDYGSSKTPKVGLKYQPVDAFAIRGNWGKGFRAPTLPEISPSTATFFTSVVDPLDGVSRSISGVYVGNPTLKPETSTSATAGIVFEPVKEFSTSVDVYRIKWRNVVASPSFQNLINASCPLGAATPGGCPSTPNILRDPATGQVVSILGGYVNLNERRTTGVDIDARYTLPTTAFGKFVIRANVSYIASLTENGVECAGHEYCTYEIPRIKGRFTLDYDYGPVSLTGAMNYTHSYHADLAPASQYTDANSPQFQNGALSTKIPIYRTYDLFGKYNLTKNLTINASVTNIFNQLPPYDPGFTNLYDGALYDIRGRIYRASLTYKM
jgi:iron complex outermembrane receptor protein